MIDPSRAFADQLADPQCGVAVDDRGAQVALIALGGLSGAMDGVPPFEFFGLTRDLDVTRVFVRDQSQVWYRNGVPGLGPDLPAVSRALMELVDRLGVTPVLFGASAGGFAATAIGLLARFPHVHALAPQTTIGVTGRLLTTDRRWRPNISKTRRSAVRPFVSDVKRLFSENAGVTSVHLYYAADCRPDRLHAKRLGDMPSVTLHEYQQGGHSLAKVLRETGELEDIVRRALNNAR